MISAVAKKYRSGLCVCVCVLCTSVCVPRREKRRNKKQQARRFAAEERKDGARKGQDTPESVSFCEFFSLEKEHLKSLFFDAVDDRLCVFRGMKTNVRRGCSENYKNRAEEEMQNASAVKADRTKAAQSESAEIAPLRSRNKCSPMNIKS